MLQHHADKAAYAGGESTAPQFGSARHPASCAPCKQPGVAAQPDKQVLLEHRMLSMDKLLNRSHDILKDRDARQAYDKQLKMRCVSGI